MMLRDPNQGICLSSAAQIPSLCHCMTDSCEISDLPTAEEPACLAAVCAQNFVLGS